MTPENFYHIYNRGNNREPIFFNRENYMYFLRKVRHHLLPHLEILAYCLMPNHFHFLVFSKEDIAPENFSNDLKIMLRSYTRAINKQEGRTGSLFAQNTKIKLLEEEGSHAMTQSHGMTKNKNFAEYPFTCFHYIHQNPMKAKLVKRMENYEMSSFQDFAGMRNGTLCNRRLAVELLGLPASSDDFLKESYAVQIIDED